MSFHSPTANSGKSSKDPMFDEFTYCLRCGRPETSADITFDEMKICTACRSSEQKMHINWAEREKKLREVLARYKERANGGYDCIIPISGGKDSVFQLYLLTKVYGMNPLTVTFSHNWFTETGRRNLTNALNRLGLDHMEFTPNRQLVNRLARESLHQIGDSCWHCHMGVEAFPLHIATKFKIPLLIYGESVADASGKATYLDNPEFGIDYFLKFSAKVSAAQMACENINAAELQSFVPPSAEEIEKAGIVRIFLGDFIFWDGERQTEFVRDYLGWQEHDVEGTFKRYKSVECIMPGVHDYTKFLKRGFGRGTDFAVGDVRAGLGTREEGFKLSKSYDPVRPKILDYYLKVADYSENEFEQIIASKRQGAAAKFMDGPAVLKQDAEHPVNESVLTAVKTVDEELAIVEQINSITNERLWPGLGTFDQRLEKHREEFESAPGLIRGEVEHPYLLTATQSLDLLAKRKMSTVELARSYADRIADLEPKLHAWAAHDREWMLIQSWLVHKERSLRQPRSSLAGIPIVTVR